MQTTTISRHDSKKTHPYGVFIVTRDGSIIDSCHTSRAAAIERQRHLIKKYPKDRHLIGVGIR